MREPEKERSFADLLRDPLLRDVPTVEGFKVLEPVVLYDRLGGGGMGAVYRGRHLKLDLDVAVKCLKPSLAAEDEDYVRRFEREARLAACITHQNVVRVMEVQERHGIHYLVMEFVRGETVGERIQRKGPLAEREALAILCGAATGLAEAHGRGIVHRDIKPDNILVSLEGRVKLADLGLAKATGSIDGRSLSGSSSSSIMGTPQYMSPEQWSTTDVTPAADVWALGATFYHACAGQAGIAAVGGLHEIAKRINEQEFPNLRLLRPDLRPEVHAMFERCVRRQPLERFADARALLQELRSLLAEDVETVLHDKDSGSGIDRFGVVTPPPRQTMLRIRAGIEGVAAPVGAAAAPARPGRSSRQRPSAARDAAESGGGVRLLSYAAVGLLTVGVAVWLLIDRPAQASEPEGQQNAQRAEAEEAPSPPPDDLAPARRAIASGDYAAAIARLKPLLDAPEYREAAQDLTVEALIRDGRQQLELAPGIAFDRSNLALGLRADHTAAAQLREEAIQRLRVQLASAVHVIAPDADVRFFRSPPKVVGTLRGEGLELEHSLSTEGVVASPYQRVDVQRGDFTLHLPEFEGLRQLVWRVRDVARDVTGDVPPRALVVDRSPPRFGPVTPTADSTIGVQFSIRGSVLDETPCEVRIASGGKGSFPVNADGSFLAAGTLPPGSRELALEVVDSAGNQSGLTRFVVDGTKPDLSMNPPKAATSARQIKLQGRVEDPGHGVVGVSVWHGQEELQVRPDGTFEFLVRLDSEGPNRVGVLARDGVGNESVREVVVERDTAGPVLAPDPMPPAFAGPILVTGKWSDPSGCVRIAAPRNTPVKLDPERRRFELVVDAKDAIGSSRVEGRSRLYSLPLTAVDGLGNEQVVTIEIPIIDVSIAVRKNSIGLRMMPVPPPGSKAGSLKEARQQFWMGEIEVTREMWAQVMKKDGPWRLYLAEDDSLPATYVSYEQALDFCKELNKLESASLPEGLEYALPTLEQWRFACRAGSPKDFWCGNILEQGVGVANAPDTDSRKFGAKSATGDSKRKANPFQLVDMHGNVEEWCEERMACGGCWSMGEESCRSDSVRKTTGTGERDIGFRLVLRQRRS